MAKRSKKKCCDKPKHKRCKRCPKRRNGRAAPCDALLTALLALQRESRA